MPYEEYGCALVYFTGSAHFNRSLRHLCKKQNMSLNEHALKIGVVRKVKERGSGYERLSVCFCMCVFVFGL